MWRRPARLGGGSLTRLAVAIALAGAVVVVPSSPPAEAFPLSVLWGARAGGGFDAWDEGFGIAADGEGNAYVTGVFDGNAQFGPFTLTVAGGFGDAFVAKLDSSGEFEWVSGIGSSAYDEGRGVAVDGEGNSYFTGFFSGTVDVEPGPGVFNLTSAGGRDTYLLKLDPDGTLVWAQRFGGPGSDAGNDVAVDEAGNVYLLGGGALNLAKFDGDGTMIWQQAGVGGSGGLALDGSGSIYVLGGGGTVVKLDEVGDRIWLRQPDKLDGHVSSRGIDADGYGNVYTTGRYYGTVDFDPGPEVFTLEDPGDWGPAYVTKLDGDGNFGWADDLGGSFKAEGFDVAADESGNVYTTGFQGGSLSRSTKENIFVSMHETKGTLVSEAILDSFGTDIGYAIALDGARNVYVTGTYTQWLDLDPGDGTYWLQPIGGFDIFVSATAGWLDCGGQAPTIVGTEADERLVGTSGADVIHGLGGNDTIFGLAGDDLICGGNDDDTLYGNAGNDTLFGQRGNDLLSGSNGDDILHGGGARDTLRGHGGADILYGGLSRDLLVGGAGNDELHGGGAADVLRGSLGNDRLFGDGGTDTLSGGPGTDDLNGGPGTDACKSGENLIACEP